MWRLAAVESRPTEGAAPPSDPYRAPARTVPQESAYKRVSYLADSSSEATCLMTVTTWTRSRAHPLLVERAVRAHWRSVLKLGRSYGQRADLTRRFIKATTGHHHRDD